MDVVVKWEVVLNSRQEILGIISARGGSKGIPRKNLVEVGGRPLIAWTIEAAKCASSVNRVVVSTDDAEIADVARAWGAEIPFLRPSELARDDTAGIVPVLHAVKWLADHERYEPHHVVLLQPTSPLRTSEDIDSAVRLLLEGTDAVVSVTVPDHHPCWMKKVVDNGWLEDAIAQNPSITRRQDLPEVYALNGAIYAVRRAVLLQQKTLCPCRTKAYIMPAERSVDVDSTVHLRFVDFLLHERENTL